MNISEIVVAESPLNAVSVTVLKQGMKPLNAAAVLGTMSCMSLRFAVNRYLLFWAPNSLAGSAMVPKPLSVRAC